MQDKVYDNTKKNTKQKTKITLSGLQTAHFYFK